MRVGKLRWEGGAMATAIHNSSHNCLLCHREPQGPAGATPNSPLTPARPSLGGGEGGRS